MKQKISVVINTLNEEKNIARAIKSVEWVDEIIVCDMYSEDQTVQIAKKLGAKVIYHKKVGFVEPARNFAIAKASSGWVLILDADEEIPASLAKKLRSIAKERKLDFIQLPRKNIIFNKWMKASQWWPDYNIRFFKKGQVSWGEEIHRPPKTLGQGDKLEAAEELAILHHHYSSVTQFIDRMNRYTSIEAKELQKAGYKFLWTDIIDKPTNEFLSRFFAGRGFEDGLHGLALSFLQALSFLVVYLKVWEGEKFREQELTPKQTQQQAELAGKDINYWFKYGDLSANKLKSVLQRFKNKFI